jgi:hypothetical protein
MECLTGASSGLSGGDEVESEDRTDHICHGRDRG